jgi:hypothetical protein
MLKIYINNEEVIANQNFTIQKHMLNTPSVILNNVCPKTWCNEKDYITNFYHPLDYSKCKIVDETFHPYDPGETIKGTSFTIQNYDSTKLVELTELDGNTTQSGTPTPSSPQPINVVSGRQEVDIVGKNLLGLKNGTYTSYEITAVVENGEITLNGTAGGNRFVSITLNNNLGITQNETITLSMNNAVANSNIKFRINSGGQLDTTLNAINKTQTINTGAYTDLLSSSITIRVQSGATLENFKLKPMIEKGSTASQWEEYKGQGYEINLGKNLLPNTNTTQILNNITFTKNDDDSIKMNGTANANTPYRINTLGNELSLPAGTYTISTGNNLTSGITLQGWHSTATNFVTIQSSSNKASFTLTSDVSNVRFQIFIANGTQISNLTIYPMLEKGSQATSYAPYKTPIELCKIGTYQDRIYQDNNKWYIERQVGKVVLNGSENWNYNSTTNSFVIYNPISDIKDKEQYSSQTIIPPVLMNYYKGQTWQNFLNGATGFTLYYANNVLQLRLSSTLTTASDFKTWLSTHNTIVYYVLATPTTTEITDTELISQLNAIELLEGLNNVSVSSGDLPGEITIHYNYKEAYTTEDLLFCGVVKNSGKISLNPREPHYTTLQVLDFKDFLSSGETLDFVIYQKTILEAIQQVISTVQDYGFILGNVNILNPNEIIGAYSTKDKTAYDVFNYIADITQSRWTTRMIDENTVAIDFYDPTLMPQGTEIDYTNAYFNDKLIDDMKYSYGTNNYRNKQVMISKQVYSNISQAQTIVANGYQTQFPTEQPIGKINSITSNGIPLTFATFNEKDMGYVADFYYNPGDNYFESDDLRSAGEVLIIDYVAIVEGRQVITNSTEIDRIQESTGRKGIIARYETRNDATTSTELQKIGESYIKYKGTPEIVLTIQSRKNTWEVGQRVQFNAPIDELKTEYMVRSKKINYIANQQENESQLFYTYELISSFNSETEINYFDNQRAKASGNIGEGEYISRNIDIESLAQIIFYDTTTTEVQVSGDNELNAILNSPFIS